MGNLEGRKKSWEYFKLIRNSFTLNHPKSTKEKGFREILMKLQKEGISKVDREIYKELLGCINKTQQELNNLKFSNKMKKGRIERLRDKYHYGKNGKSPENIPV